MSNEINANEVVFKRSTPIYASTENWKAYSQSDLKAIVVFGADYPETTLRKIYDRCGASVPFNPSDMEAYIVVFCDKTKSEMSQRRVDIYAFFGDAEEKAFTLTPNEVSNIMAQYSHPTYGSALDLVRNEENIHGDKIKVYEEGSEYAGDFAADLAAIAATQSSWKKPSEIDNR